MKEHEMRERIERLVRRAAVPAGVGITMALAGCGGKVELVDGSTEMAAATGGSGGGPTGPVAIDPPPIPGPREGAGGAVPDYMAQMPDATAPPQPLPMPLYMALMPDAATVDASHDAARSSDASTLDVIIHPIPLYGGPFPLYMALMPDAGPKDGG